MHLVNTLELKNIATTTKSNKLSNFIFIIMAQSKTYHNLFYIIHRIDATVDNTCPDILIVCDEELIVMRDDH